MGPKQFFIFFCKPAYNKKKFVQLFLINYLIPQKSKKKNNKKKQKINKSETKARKK